MIRITRSPNSHTLILLVLSAASFFFLSPNTAPARAGGDGNTTQIIRLGKWTEAGLNQIMSDSANTESSGEQIDFISEKFLDTPYLASTLTGDINTPEVFTINLEGMDCFTYIDYVEAMKLSRSFPEFESNLKRIRYKDGEIAFQNRNHFFSDWAVYNNGEIVDVTSEIGGEKTKAVSKNLNQKKDGTYYLPGIPVTGRIIYYIPSAYIDKNVMDRMKTGDYVGIYTDIDGLDVSHTGIIIKKGDDVFLRHASSRKGNEKVVDEELSGYIQNKPGLVIYRPVK